MYIDFAKAFNKSAGFGLGMLVFPFVFNCLVAFSREIVWKDGSYANAKDDFVTNAASTIKNTISKDDKTDAQAIDKLKDLKALFDSGVITEEEFNAKKEDLLKRI